MLPKMKLHKSNVNLPPLALGHINIHRVSADNIDGRGSKTRVTPPSTLRKNDRGYSHTNQNLSK